MSWALASHLGGSGSGSAAVAFSPNTIAGSILLANMLFPATSTFTSITDTAGNTWIQLGAEGQTNAGTKKMRWYYAVSIGGASTVTATASTGTVQLGIAEFTATANWELEDTAQSADNPAATTTWSVGPVTTTVSGDLLVSQIGLDATRTPNDPDDQGYTVSVANGVHLLAYSLDVGVAGDYSESGSLASTTRKIAVLAVFKPLRPPNEPNQRVVVAVCT